MFIIAYLSVSILQSILNAIDPILSQNFIETTEMLDKV